MPIAYTNEARDYATVSAPPVATMRKFGIELEMVAPEGTSPLARANEIVRAAGTPMMTNSHFGRAYDMWQAKPDGSITPYDRGVEVVSRIMPASPVSYDEIRQAVAPLDAAGFGVNRSCGFHVHVNVSDLPMTTRQLIVLRYAQIQADIDAMLPPSRRDNPFCRPLGIDGFSALARYIDSGSYSFPQWQRYSVTNIAWINQSGDGARIEFRQAAATVNADKVIAWVRFLQEMVTEVARRAQGLTFGTGRAPVPAWRAEPRPQTFGGRVPHMRHGSDNERAMTQLRTTGVITTSWARDMGIAPNVLRRVIVGFRRHGAGIITQRTNDGPSYALAGANQLPVPLAQVFAGTTIQPAPVAPPPMPAAVATTTRAAEFVAYAFNDGLSLATVEWCASRVATFARR